MEVPAAMTCVEIAAPGDLRVLERDVPSPKRGEVLVRVTAAGICGSDVELLAGQRPAEYSRYPIVPGHEWTGTIAALGEDVDGPDPGTPVIACGIRGCGSCARCREGLANLCATGYSETGFTEPGGWAGYVVVPAHLVHRLHIPAGVDPAVAALLEPAACVANALLRPASVLRPVCTRPSSAPALSA
jgi:threonine dehydrogenase-like Zn-dependent dehydrogenase